MRLLYNPPRKESAVRIYVIAETLAQYQDALRQLRTHERAAVHVTREADLEGRDGPLFEYAEGTVTLIAEAPARGARLAA